MRERYPVAREIAYRWSGQVMETHDYLAFLGRNPGEDNVYIVTGDSGMGMTHGTIGALIITDLIHGAEVPWADLYDPARITLGATRTFAKEAANMAWQYTDWLTRGEAKDADEVAPGSGAVVRRGAHKIAVYPRRRRRAPRDVGRLHAPGLHRHVEPVGKHLGLQVPRLSIRRDGPGDERARRRRSQARGRIIGASRRRAPCDSATIPRAGAFRSSWIPRRTVNTRRSRSSRSTTRHAISPSR
jgi:hypothetical protein